MIRGMKILCLIDSEVKPGDRWLWDFLPDQTDEVDFLSVTPSDRFPKWGKIFDYYPPYVLLALRALVQTARKKYDVVVAWEGKNGFALALARSLLGIRAPKFVVLAYSQRGLVCHLPFLTRFALRSVDTLAVLSERERNSYSRRFEFPQEKIVLTPLGWYDPEVNGDQHSPVDVEPYIFASGRSFRDYATFMKALEGIESNVIVNARAFNLKGIDIPPRVVVNDLLPMADFWQLLAQCRFVVVPLLKVEHAAGDGHIVQAMAAGKAVIATRGPSTETYLEHGVTGLLVPPGDAHALHDAMKFLLTYPDEAAKLGANARQRYEEQYTFSAMARRVDDLLHQVVVQ